MSKKPLPCRWEPSVGDVVIGKYAKLDGSVDPRVVIGLDSWESMDDSAVTVDREGKMMTIELKDLKYVINPMKDIL
jgi:frataxin-like iron-binding protein CyaY